jgi:thiamine biosynthesis lipoprotein
MLRLHGANSALVDLGGDVRVVGPQPGDRPWRVGVRDPRAPDRALASVPLREGAITTSGDYERFMIVDGVRYAHILDPRTGWPVSGSRSVTVVAPLCTIAGSATTIAMLRGDDAGEWLEDLGLPHLRVDRFGKTSGSLAGSASARPQARPDGFTRARPGPSG